MTTSEPLFAYRPPKGSKAAIAPGAQARSTRQWKVYILVRLLAGWQLENILAEVTAGGVDPADAATFAKECVAEMRKSMSTDALWGVVGVILGTVAFFNEMAISERTGETSIFVLFAVMVPIGVFYLVRAWQTFTKLPKSPVLES
jgi:hypothetical protein